MEKFTTDLYANMQARLREISASNEGPLDLSDRSFQVAGNHIKELRAFARDYAFKDKEQEVRFFKEIKPRFLKEVIYFLKLFEIESSRPVGTAKMQERYLRRQSKNLHTYFKRHKFLYTYYQTRKNHLDEEIFVRNPREFPLYPHYSLDNDPGFSNVYSYRLAKIQAFEEIIGYLQSALHAIGHGGEKTATDPKGRSPLTFTGSNAQFIELGYSLQCAAVFNNGRADVKQVMEWLQYCFNIRVTNYYGYFQSMRIRKKGRTPFLEYLIDKLNRRMDDSDETPSGALV